MATNLTSNTLAGLGSYEGATVNNGSSRTLSHITAQADGSQGRTEYRNNLEYYVVPVAGLGGNVVIKGVNSVDYEFVPADVISRAPSAWDGRYLFPDHPQPVTEGANRPEIIDNESFGQVFNSRYEDDKLRLEAWIDVARAKELGGEPLRVYNECVAGNMVEISTSAWTTMIKSNGVYNGQRYGYRWLHVAPDHLAMGLYGKRGAYSIESGGGAPRSNQGSEDDNNMPSINDTNSVLQAVKGVLAKVFGTVSSNTSDVVLRRSLEKVLVATQPAYWGIRDVDPDEGKVVFETCIDGRWESFQISFTKDDKDNVELVGEAVLVKIVKTYSPLGEGDDDSSSSSTSSSTSTNDPAGDGAPRSNTPAPNNSPIPGRTDTEDAMPNDALAALVTQVLAANSETMTEETHGNHLRALPEGALKAMIPVTPASNTEGDSAGNSDGDAAAATSTSTTKAANKGSAVPTPASAAADPATATLKPATMTLASFMEVAPPEIQALVTNAARVSAARKTFLIKGICSQSGGQVTEDELKNHSEEDLTLMAKISGVVSNVEDEIMSYAGLPLPQAPNAVLKPLPKVDAWGLDADAKPIKAAATN